VKKRPSKKLKGMPKIFFDKDNDFASIRLTDGIEAKSYEKDSFIFLEDSKGKIIEIQILNLSRLADGLKHTA